MAQVVVAGAGVSGCTVAYTLAENGVEVVLVEKTGKIGGKVCTYGCKAVEKCQNCGVCLTTGLWEKVSAHRNISVYTNSVIKDVTGEAGDFNIRVTGSEDSEIQGEWSFTGVDAIVVGTGFKNRENSLSSHIHIEGTNGLITGTELEELMYSRTRTGLFNNGLIKTGLIKTESRSIAFIQCAGSRDKNENGLYCSRVCCSYSTRTAKVIRSYYPECEIVFFYMELQNVESGDYYSGLRELGMEFINCRPSGIKCGEPGTPVTVIYDDVPREFDLVVLSDGIHADESNGLIAGVCRLGQDKDGFLFEANNDSGIYVTGCVKRPMKIDEAYADAISTAGRILSSTLESSISAKLALSIR